VTPIPALGIIYREAEHKTPIWSDMSEQPIELAKNRAHHLLARSNAALESGEISVENWYRQGPPLPVAPSAPITATSASCIACSG
jgi:hypothetical protein